MKDKIQRAKKLAGAMALASIGMAFFEKTSWIDWTIGITAVLFTGSLLVGAIDSIEREWKETTNLIERLSRKARCRYCGRTNPEVLGRCKYCNQSEWQIEKRTTEL